MVVCHREGPEDECIRIGGIFFQMLDKVQEKMTHITNEVKVREEYGIYRSIHRGFTTHSINMGVTEAGIIRKNRWRKVESASNRHASVSMIEHYTQIKQDIKTLLRYSQAL